MAKCDTPRELLAESPKLQRNEYGLCIALDDLLPHNGCTKLESKYNLLEDMSTALQAKLGLPLRTTFVIKVLLRLLLRRNKAYFSN